MSNDLLPPNASDFERVLSYLGSRPDDLTVPVRDIWNPSKCPADLLPWLAWAFSVDAWSSSWTEDQKRETIRRSIRVHQHKGTYAALRDALAALGFPVIVQEWYQQTPKGKPYTFKLIIAVDQIGVPTSKSLDFMSVVIDAKNLRSHLDIIQLQATTKLEAFVGASTRLGSEMTVVAGDEQFVAIIPDFMPGAAAFDQLINVDLVAAMGIKP